MTKIADIPSFTPSQLAELRDVFARFELILGIFHDFQNGMSNVDMSFGEVPFLSVLRLFSDSWRQNCLLFSRFLSSSDFHLEEISSHIHSVFSVFIASEFASSVDFQQSDVAPPCSASYSFLLQCVCLRCRTLLTAARRKLMRLGVVL